MTTESKASRKRAAPFRCRLVVMAKLPVAGRIKTRLARGVGVAQACRFYRTTSRAVLHRLSAQPFWETIIAVEPDCSVASRNPAWGQAVRRIGQGSGDLGARMQRPMRKLPPGPVCVVGTDVPGIAVEAVRSAFRQLGGRADWVFGPASDGGFWLVGARRRPRLVEPYGGVRWSTAETLAEVEANLAGETVGRTHTLDDVDDATDLARTRGTAGRLVRPLAGRA